MKELPNGLIVFNATPHPLRFWHPSWPEPVEVPPDEVINARRVEKVVQRFAIPPALPSTWSYYDREAGTEVVEFVTTTFVGDTEGEAIIERAFAQGAHVVVGSIIAAQAYPGRVVAPVPAPGYERAEPAKKRARPDKFVVF